jgi:hypothetical protein
VCGARVFAHVGEKTAPYFAHAKGSSCEIRSGETAAHLNTKYHIAAALKEAAALRIRETCVGTEDWGSCGRWRDTTFARGWDEVRVEHRLGKLRPDISLTRAGQPVAAIEVRATHPVPPEKVVELARMEVSWVEVWADERLYGGSEPWTADVPLPSLRGAPGVGWRCRECASEIEAEERARREAEEEDAYRLRCRKRRVKIVDVYRPTGRRFREVFWIVAEVQEGVITSFRLWRDGLQNWLGSAIRAQPRPNGVEHAWREILHRLDQWTKRQERGFAQVDHVTALLPATALKGMSATDIARLYPPRLRWEAGTGWIPREAAKPAPRESGMLAAPAAPEPPIASVSRDQCVSRYGCVVDAYLSDGGTKRRIVWREIFPASRRGWFRGQLVWSEVSRPFCGLERSGVESCEADLNAPLEATLAAESDDGILLAPATGWIETAHRNLYLAWNAHRRLMWDDTETRWVPHTGGAGAQSTG